MISHTLIFLAQATPPAGVTPKAADPSVNMLVMLRKKAPMRQLMETGVMEEAVKEQQGMVEAESEALVSHLAETAVPSSWREPMGWEWRIVVRDGADDAEWYMGSVPSSSSGLSHRA